MYVSFVSQLSSDLPLISQYFTLPVYFPSLHRISVLHSLFNNRLLVRALATTRGTQRPPGDVNNTNKKLIDRVNG